MVQVKVVRAKANKLEMEINDQLMKLGHRRGYKVNLIDIKLYHIGSEDIDTAMIIYNITEVPSSRPASK